MKLWTWQDKELDITDGNQKVCPGEDSSYRSNKKHMEAYKELYRRIGHHQFHWYFTSEEGAKSHIGERASCADHYQLWEVTVDETSVLRKVCGITWAWILGTGGGGPPLFWESLWAGRTPEYYLDKDRDRNQFEKDLHGPWRGLEEPKWWDHLFIDSVVPGCTQVLLKHPVDPRYAKRIDKSVLHADGQSTLRKYSGGLCAECLIENGFLERFRVTRKS
jgi:hypothetical protein